MLPQDLHPTHPIQEEMADSLLNSAFANFSSVDPFVEFEEGMCLRELGVLLALAVEEDEEDDENEAEPAPQEEEGESNPNSNSNSNSNSTRYTYDWSSNKMAPTNKK